MGSFLQLHISDFIGISLLIGFFSYYSNRLRTARTATVDVFNSLVGKWNNEISDLLKDHNIANIDIEYADITKVERKIQTNTIIDVGKNIAKGYDFFHCLFEPGYSMDLHAHNDTVEFMYVLHGKNLLTIDGKDIELKKGDYYLIPRATNHKFKALEYGELIIIALPPMLLENREA